MKINAKDEFLKHIKSRKVKCAIIEFGDYRSRIFALNSRHNDITYERFLNDIDFNYNCGYGSQQLFGTIWYIDGSWSERFEFDGSECWAYKTKPKIPDFLY